MSSKKNISIQTTRSRWKMGELEWQEQTKQWRRGRAMLKRHSSGGRLGQAGISTNSQGRSFLLKRIAAAVVADINRPRLEIRRHILIFRIIVVLIAISKLLRSHSNAIHLGGSLFNNTWYCQRTKKTCHERMKNDVTTAIWCSVAFHFKCGRHF